MNTLRYPSDTSEHQPARGMDVETTLAHFAIITYMVDPEALRPHVHERFELDCIAAPDGSLKALISVVPFLDQDFRFAACPWPRASFAQTNYRAYVTDSVTGEHVAWFFGTALSNWRVAVPRFCWSLPWHRADIQFETDYDTATTRYTKYEMTSCSAWAPAELSLEDTGCAPQRLLGFADLESGSVLLTHPMRGYFHRRDGRLGNYAIWHDRLALTEGRVTQASFPLLDRLGVVKEGDVSAIHSVLMMPRTDFIIYLPPTLA